MRHPILCSVVLVTACTKAVPRASTPPPVTEYPVPSAVAPRTEVASERVFPARCPVRAKGVQIVARDTPAGAALEFVTVEDPSDLRTQLFAIADVHNALTARLSDVGREVPESSVDATGPRPTPSVEISAGGIVEEEHTIAAEEGPPETTFAGGMGVRSTPRTSTDTSEQLVMTPSRAHVEYQPYGGRVVYDAAEAGDVDELRAELQAVADTIEDACAWGAAR